MGISLEKRAEKVNIILAKRNITQIPPVRVGLALDISGSTQSMYNRGVMQETVDRLLAVAMKFDDNGELDMWSFTEGFNRLDTATAADYNGYVKRAILENRRIEKWGGTAYGPVMNDMVKHYFNPSPIAEAKGMLGGLFSKKPAAPSGSTAPAMGIVVTDGANSDRYEAAKIMREAQKHNIYWQMVGVGPDHYFSFIQEMADELPNVGFINLNSLEMTDEQLYEQVVGEEFCEWLKKF